MKVHLGSISALLLLIISSPTASATSLHSLGSFLPHHRRHIDADIFHDAFRLVNKELESRHERRHPIAQQPPPSIIARGETPTSAPDASTFDEAAFDASAHQACVDALCDRTEVVNPSGVVACYNVAFYDNTTGVFQTDIRLYRMSPAVDEFANTSASDYMLSVSIPQATLSSPQRTIPGGSLSGHTSDGKNLTIDMLEGFQSVGQLSTLLRPEKLTDSNLRVLMIPNLTMTAINPNTKSLVTTTLSSDTLSYVAGKLVQDDGKPTNITLPEANSLSTAIVASATKFVLPGTKIMVFPTGLIITSIWTALFVGIVGFGTVGRYRFRQSYRRRLQISVAAGKSGFGKL